MPNKFPYAAFLSHSSMFCPRILVACVAAAAADSITRAVAEPITFPIKVAEGKHTFADAKGQPFFWLGTTQWELFRYYPMVTADYTLKPVKPTLMAEGAYEAGEEYGFAVTPLWVRRQAYYSYLAGGHHTYGHNDSWRILPTWKQALDAPGARQMGILRKIFEARPEWWLMEPDQSLFASGGKTDGRVLCLAARHRDGQWAMIYLGDHAEFSVNLGKLSAPKLNASWINPADGKVTPLGPLSNQGVQSFTTPGDCEDSLLVLEFPDGKAK